MRVLVSGSNGLVGRALIAHLNKNGHETVALRRVKDASSYDSPIWEPIRNLTWEQDIGPVDAVVHLAGENIGARRWTRPVKQRIRDSRILGTEQLCRHLATLTQKPSVLVAASAVGYFGDRADEFLTEKSAPGTGFLAEVCRDWEAACKAAAQADIRVINLRFGMVLAKDGGALAKLLPIFRLGLGGRLGSGDQWTSWITLEDLISVIERALFDRDLKGQINAVSPNPVTNREFTRILGRVLHRPAVFALPAALLRAVKGDMVDSLLLASARVKPSRLLEIGFRFQYPDLETALRNTILMEN
jgi:uncharacterized protein (TIGR01777 family)